MPPTIRVLVLDDNLLARNTLGSALATANALRLVAEITELQRFPLRCRALQPHIVLIGSVKPFIVDIPALAAQASLHTKVIALLDLDDPLRAQALLKTNLAGGLLRSEISENLMHAIHAVAHGGTWFSRAIVERLVAPQPVSQPPDELEKTISSQRLTRRDQQILACLRRGDDNAQIGAALHLADQTVRNYVHQVCKKLGVPRDQLGKPRQTKP